jgi:hypothetical protein
MAIIQRPTKQGGATTFQGKVAQGYTKILASEADADIDTIFAAWNGGADTVNLRDNAVTSAKIAPGAVGARELADGSIGLGEINQTSLAAWVPSGSTGLTPATAGQQVIVPGDANMATVLLGGATAKGRVQTWSTGTQGIGLFANRNWQTNAQDDATKPSWGLQMPSGTDSFLVQRAPAGSTTQTAVLQIGADGTTTLAGKLIGGATVGARVQQMAPASLAITTYDVFVLVQALPAITTRGGPILLVGNQTLSYTQLGASGSSNVVLSWFRNGVALADRSARMGGATVQPIAPLFWIDVVPAGTYTYDLRVNMQSGTSGAVNASGWGSQLMAQELG